MTKSHPKYITDTAKKFLTDVQKPTHALSAVDEDGTLWLCNENAIYVGEMIDGLDASPDEHALGIMQKFVKELVQHLGNDAIPITADEIKAVLAQRKNEPDTYLCSEGCLQRYEMTNESDVKIVFNGRRLIRDIELLGKHGVTITLPITTIKAARLSSDRGAVFQLPVRL